MLTLATLVAISSVAFFLSLKDPRVALALAVFLLPWQGLDVDIGLRVTAYLLVFVPLALVTLLRMVSGGGHQVSAWIHVGLGVYAMYAIAWSVLQIPFLPDVSVEGGQLRSPVARALAQILMFGITVAPVFVVPYMLRYTEELLWLGKIYIVSTLVLATVGWVQIAIWQATGINPMPIGFMNDLLGGMGEEARVGIVQIAEIPVFRMNSLGGEPKDLGVGLAVAMLLIQAGRLGLVVRRSVATVVWIFLAVSTVATFSTAALYLWILGTAVQWVLSALMRTGRGSQRIWLSRIVLLISLVAAATGLFQLVDLDRRTGESIVADVLYARTLGRENPIIEDFDQAILAFFQARPIEGVFGVGVGNIHLFANAYLAPEVAEFAEGTAFTAKHGFLWIITGTGVVGLGTFLWWVISQLTVLRHCTRQTWLHDFTWKSARVTLVFGATMLAAYLAVTAAAVHFYFALGASVLSATLLCRGPYAAAKSALDQSSCALYAPRQIPPRGSSGTGA